MRVERAMLPVLAVLCVSLVSSALGCRSAALIPFATFDPRTNETLNLRRDLLAPTFEDGMPVINVRVEKHGAKFYMIREGQSGSVQRISRTPLVVDRNGGLLLRKNGDTTETCTGNPCSHCNIKPAGGCECKDTSTGGEGGIPTGSCNHTITKGTSHLIRSPASF